jgi:hypothetical protein
MYPMTWPPLKEDQGWALFIHSFILSFHKLLGFELSVAQLRRLAPISKERKFWAKGFVKVITDTKIRLRHRHIGCLISTKDLKVDCQRQRPDRVSILTAKKTNNLEMLLAARGRGHIPLTSFDYLGAIPKSGPSNDLANLNCGPKPG